jgi:hypothetical protein
MVYQYRIIIYNVNADGRMTDIKCEFFIGNDRKKYYIDYLKENGESVAEDMKFINTKYEISNEKKWWKKKMLWNKSSHFENLQDIKKYYNITLRAGNEVIILAKPLNHLIV